MKFSTTRDEFHGEGVQIRVDRVNGVFERMEIALKDSDQMVYIDNASEAITLVRLFGEMIDAETV